MSTRNLLINGKMKIALTQNEYKAQGGQGIVYVKGNLAYKVYHEPKNMIPEMKVKELASIQLPVVLAPQDALMDTNGTLVGFTMPYVKDTEYLTKMFSRRFKDINNIDNNKIVNLVTEMQKTLSELHKKKIIVGDYNEMNFLVDSTFSIPYHIDVDSYQTPNFPCTAIMNTVRDRRLPFGQFDELSDWFSWAIVTFQMYTGIHPYMGNHPKFKSNDLDGRMLNRISVFDPDVKVPKTCSDFSVIPQNQLEWYKKVFIDGYRSEPPLAGAFGFVAGYTAIVTNNGAFITDEVFDYKEKIISVYHINGTRYVITEKHIYKNASDIFTFTKSPTNIRLLTVAGAEPVIAATIPGYVKLLDLSRNEIGSISSDGSMVSNGVLYTVYNGTLYENTLSNGMAIMHIPTQIDSVTPVFKAFDGVIVQDLFGQCRLSIPYRKGVCASIMVPEMDGYRVIDGKREGQFAEFVLEKGGTYDRLIVYFSSDFRTYECVCENDVLNSTINMIVRQNGMKVSICGTDTLELMMDVQRGARRVNDCPADNSTQLVDGIDRLMFISNTKLHAFKMK